MPQRHSANHKAPLYAALLLFAFLSGGIGEAAAQTLTQMHPLRFGRIVMHDNDAERNLRLLPSGNYSADPGFYVIDTPPQLGTFRIEGQQANSIMDISIVQTTTVNPTSGLGYFSLVDFFTVPSTVITDNDGNVTFQIGATLRSNGMTGVYNNADYRGIFTISVEPQ